MKKNLFILIILSLSISVLIVTFVNLPPVKDYLQFSDKLENDYKTIEAPKIKFEVLKNYKNTNKDIVIAQSENCPIAKKTNSKNGIAWDGLNYSEIYDTFKQKGFEKKYIEQRFTKLNSTYINMYIGEFDSNSIKLGCLTGGLLGVNTITIDNK